MSSRKTKNLHDAKRNKKDEFYTLYSDVQQAMKQYAKFLNGKTVYCNCDNPYRSNFVRYFMANFNKLGLKRLVATCHDGSSAERSLFNSGRCCGVPFFVDVTHVPENFVLGDNLDDVFRMDGNQIRRLSGNGDFRSSECVRILNESDVIVTNPPFSLFKDLVVLLTSLKKDFILLGNLNAVWTNGVFESCSNGTIKVRRNGISSAPRFIDDNGMEVGGPRCAWFSTFGSCDETTLKLRKTYFGNAGQYPFIDGKNVINVDFVKDIPSDYYGEMAVPVTFMLDFNPSQFAVVGRIRSPFVNGVAKYNRIVVRRIAQT